MFHSLFRGRSGKREVSVLIFLIWLVGAVFAVMGDFRGEDLSESFDLVKATFPFVSACLIGAFGLEHLYS